MISFTSLVMRIKLYSKYIFIRYSIFCMSRDEGTEYCHIITPHLLYDSIFAIKNPVYDIFIYFHTPYNLRIVYIMPQQRQSITKKRCHALCDTKKSNQSACCFAFKKTKTGLAACSEFPILFCWSRQETTIQPVTFCRVCMP